MSLVAVGAQQHHLINETIIAVTPAQIRTHGFPAYGSVLQSDDQRHASGGIVFILSAHTVSKVCAHAEGLRPRETKRRTRITFIVVLPSRYTHRVGVSEDVFRGSLFHQDSSPVRTQQQRFGYDLTIISACIGPL